MGDTSPLALPRPQPIGVFPLPAGFLLVGDGPGHDEVRTASTYVGTNVIAKP